MFTIAAVGVPVALAGMVYVLIASPRLLPSHKVDTKAADDARRYSVEMLIEKDSSVAGKSIEDAGLRHLPGVYLASIEREGELLTAPGPETLLHAGDRLIFVGRVDSIADLQKVRGLIPAADQVFKLDQPRPNRVLVEAVVSNSNPLVGKSIREGQFRTVYHAVVIAVHRGGRHLHQRIGDIVLRAGDTLLIESHPSFVDRQRNRRDFFLVSQVAGSKPPRYEKAWVAASILVCMVALVTLSPMSLLNAALLAAGAMVATGCCRSHEARGAVDLRVLLAIGAAIGIGKALDSSGAAREVARAIVSVTEPIGPVGLLAGVYLVTLVFNMLIGHAGAAVLVFPIALAAAARQDLNAMPFVISIMVAASADFASPTSYPTHIMVYGAGGYRFSDYVRFGLPLNAVAMAVTVALVPLIWPLQ
jgi:Trk K+ transport system NAD-binding subunit